MANIKTIAKESGVSVATVSRMLDPKKSALVHPETRRQIEKVIQHYQYIPNKAARALRKTSSNTIGMVTPFSTDIIKSPYFQPLIAGIIGSVYPLHYDLKWIMIRNEDAAEYNLRKFLEEHMLDGVVFLSWRLLPKLVKEIEKRSNLPLVLINDYDPRVRCSIVYSDNESGMQKIVAYLKQRYHKIGMIRGPEYVSADAVARFAAFKKCCKKMGLLLNENLIRECPRFEEQEGYKTMQAWIKTKKLPRAIFAANDQIALGAIQALRENGYKVPQDVAVAGYDGFEAQSQGPYRELTTVVQPLEQLGQAAVETLHKLISKQSKRTMQLKFEPSLKIGETA